MLRRHVRNAVADDQRYIYTYVSAMICIKLHYPESLSSTSKSHP